MYVCIYKQMQLLLFNINVETFTLGNKQNTIIVCLRIKNVCLKIKMLMPTAAK